MARPMMGEVRDGVFIPRGEVRTWGGLFPTLEDGRLCSLCSARPAVAGRHCDVCAERMTGEGDR